MAGKILKLTIGSLILIMASLSIFLFVSSFMSPYVMVTELLQEPSAYQNKNIQLVGVVASGSLSYSEATTQFILQDIAYSDDIIQVRYHDIPPNGLQKNQKIVAIGQLISIGYFEAWKLLIQCPSKYES